MSTAVRTPHFPPDFVEDTDFVKQAMKIFLRQSGMDEHFQFADLNRCEQHIVLQLAQALKKEAAQQKTAHEP